MNRSIGVRVSVASLMLTLAGACDGEGGGGGGFGGGVEIPEVTITCGEVASRDQASRAAVQAYYANDPAAYWARHGLPALARLADIRERYGFDPVETFAGIAPYADEAQLMAMVEGGQLSPELEQRFFAAGGAAPGSVFAEVMASLLRDIVLDGDAALVGIPPNANPNNPSTPLLAELYQAAYPGLGAALMPAGAKECSVASARLLDDTGGSPQCQLGCGQGDAELPGCAAPEQSGVDAGPDDNDTTKNVTTWDNITGVHWSTTYNPSCVGQGLGQCLAKLGELPQQVTCEAWNDFGKAVGVKAGGSGATADDQEEYLEGLGYCVTTAYDGISESACEEADAALQQHSCDVLFIWPGHQEMVTKIDVDANDDEKCTAHTSSWGSPATVEYKDGKASNKSDANLYPSSSKVVKNGVAASFRIICKCKD